MAQIIKHRRGSLESISGATKRAGELLVVTGSSGITAANGDSILFIGIDGSTATPANKVLQGTTVPNLSGADYDTSVDGIPFYDTNAQKLYILNKGGNVEVKATANTGGTGIVSGSEQVIGHLPTGTVSGSSQVVGILSELNSFSASEESKNSTLATYTQSVDVSLSNLNSFSASQESKDSTLATYTQSVDADLTELFATASDHETRVDALEAFSSSLGDGFITEAELAAATGALESADSAIEGRLNNIEGFTSSIDTTIKTKLDVEGVFSSSAQVNANDITNFDSNVKDKLDADGVISGSSQVTISSTTGFSDFSSSISTNVVELFATASDHESRIDVIEESLGGGGSIGARVSSLEATSASHDDRLDQLEADSGSQAGRLNNLESFSSSIETAISVDGQNVTINGNFTVSGTQTIVDSTTVQIGDNIIELNGSGAANGGLYVKDATNPNTETGSFLWDSTNDYWKAGTLGNESQILVAGGMGVISGSSQVDADSITNFDENVKAKLDADGVISGSSQVTISSTTGFSDFSSSLKSSDDAQKLRLTSLESFSASADLDITELFATASDHEVRIDAVEAFSASLNNDFETRGQGIASSSAQIVSYLDGEDVNLGGISGSTLDITGNAKIDGNLVLGGNITIGDASGDTISFGGEVSSDIIPSADNTYDLGSSSDRFAEVHATNIYGAINATNGVVSGSSQVVGILSSLNAFSASEETKNTTLATYTSSVDAHISAVNSFTNSIDTTIKTKLNVEAVVSSSAQIVTLLSNQATDFGTGRVSADSIGNADGTSTFTGSFVGDGSQLTGLVTDLRISGSTGNDVVSLLTDDLTFAGGTAISVAVTDNTITVNASDASTSAKGIASFTSTNFSVTSGDVSIKSGGVPAAALAADVAGTGISLNGIDNSIEVDYGSSSGTAVEGNTSLTVQGTNNEIEVSGGSVTLGAGGTVTIGLPDSVTIATASIQNNLSVGGDVEITGNLSVLGTTTTIDSTTVQIGDNIIELNIGGAQSTAGIQVTDVTAPNTVSGSLLWDGTNDYWKAGALGSEKELARLNTDPTTNRVLKANADGLLVDSLIEDDGTNVIITGTAELRINGATANSFVYFDSNKSLEAVTPANAGDVIQWNGSSFVASNELDGGTF